MSNPSLYDHEHVQDFFGAMGKNFDEMAQAVQEDEAGFMLHSTLSFARQVEELGPMKVAFVLSGLIVQFVLAHLEVTRLQAVLVGDPNQTEDKETHELFREASVKYAEKADRLLLEVVKLEGTVLPASLMMSIKELLRVK